VIEISRAEFITSVFSLNQLPPVKYSEIVFLGRSNVGKSSLINRLAKRKNLAKSSSTPGKTRLINFFEIVFKVEKNLFPLFFVDLPGFGYAKVPKKMLLQWQEKLSKFLKSRDSIKIFVLLIDARHYNLETDINALMFLEKIKNKNQKIFKVFTKIDKISQKQLFYLKKECADCFFVSSLKQTGIEYLRENILRSIFDRKLDNTKTDT
jgi:GTP-binding protein